MEWNEEKAQQIVKKYKSRFNFRLSFKIIRVIVSLLLLYWIYLFVLTVSYDYSKIGPRTEFYQKLAIDWTYPEFTSDIAISHHQEITPFWTQKIEFPLERRIGKNNYVVSHLNLSKPIMNERSQLEIERSYPYKSGEYGFNFYLPFHPENGRPLVGNKSPGVFETLEMVHEGSVADFAFSTNDYYSPEEILQLLADYDVDVIWMPIYMGEYQEFTEWGWSGGGNSMALAHQWGLSGARTTEDNFRSGSLAHVLNEMSVEESKMAMLDNMARMLEENKSLAERLLVTNHLQERYDYLNNEGFQVYGAVVTGPVKELLKLQEVDGLHSFQLGEAADWNWHDDHY
ncbi:anti sigma factor C-terminal domain-containing protein [Halalkalibacter kiskunsagensis]|uniref:Anti sigma factor C-terminal domain-containing protein n=1 Tax=Halalkalibacter kiskunsagensis TaxID=1548599 RepID=A0ABV6KBL7_9BACI